MDENYVLVLPSELRIGDVIKPNPEWDIMPSWKKELILNIERCNDCFFIKINYGTILLLENDTVRKKI
jgi:hypothetical protein